LAILIAEVKKIERNNNNIVVGVVFLFVVVLFFNRFSAIQNYSRMKIKKHVLWEIQYACGQAMNCHSFSYSFTHSLIHSLTCSLTYSFKAQQIVDKSFFKRQFSCLTMDEKKVHLPFV